MWDDNNYYRFNNLRTNDIIIPPGFDLPMSPEEEKKEESEIEEVIGGMEKIRISSIFEKHIPQNDWYMFFNDEMIKEYFKNIEIKFIESTQNKEIKIYPKIENIFRAFKLTNLKKIKVVIIGQDPYPGVCRKTNVPYANGLAFSVNKECSIPGSLRNMYKELEYEGFSVPKTGELEDWAKQGVLLLNTQLSVEERNPNSHRFWNEFTDNVIKHICELNKSIVFVLMGGNALKKYKLIPKNKLTKFVITSHPSVLGYKKNLRSYPPFFESNIFKNINNKLNQLSEKDIKW